METTIPTRFAIVQDDYELKDWSLAAGLLAETLGIPAVTARQQARKSHGYLAGNLSGELAQQLQAACTGHGLGVQLVPQNEVIPVVKPARVHQVWIAEDGLRVRASNFDATILLNWSTLRLIALTRTVKKESFQRWEKMSIDPDVKLKVTNRTEEFAEYLADVFAFQPGGCVLGVRLLSREVNYSEALGCLAPDGLIEANCRVEGFRLLLFAIVARAPQAYVPPESAALLTRLPLQAVRPTPPISLDNFDASNRWLLQRLRLKESQEVRAQPG